MIALLIRHASTESFRHALAGRGDGISLSAEGEKESAALAKSLENFDISAIYSSPLNRAIETARKIRDSVTIDTRLNEIDYGAWTGRSFESLNSDPLWRQFNLAQGHLRCPTGEAMLEVQARITALVEEISGRHGGGCAAFVTHAGVIRAAVCHYAGIPLDLAPRIEISPASVTAIQILPGDPRILLMNGTVDLLPFVPLA